MTNVGQMVWPESAGWMDLEGRTPLLGTRCRSGAAITLLVDEVVVTVVATVNKSESI